MIIPMPILVWLKITKVLPPIVYMRADVYVHANIKIAKLVGIGMKIVNASVQKFPKNINFHQCTYNVHTTMYTWNCIVKIHFIKEGTENWE
jgi:hypothetical protein